MQVQIMEIGDPFIMSLEGGTATFSMSLLCLDLSLY